MLDQYNEWAIALTRHFFGAHMAGKRTRLTVNEQLLNEEFGFLGGYKGFVSAVKKGPAWIEIHSPTCIHDAAKLIYEIWKTPHSRRPRNYPPLPNDSPPYLPYLVLLCLAWATDDEDLNLSGHNFYNRLELVLENHGLNSQLLKQWRIYWEELENWSSINDGQLGIWKFEYVYWVHVGIPYSQTLLTSSKLRKLPWLFHVTQLSLAAESSIPNKEQVRAILLQSESYTKQALGVFLTEKIKDPESVIGKKTISLLIEHLEEPENRIYEEDSQLRSPKNDQQKERIENLNLRIILNYDIPKKRWRLGYGLVEDQAPTNESSSLEMHFVKAGTSPSGAIWIAHKNGSPIALNGKELKKNEVLKIPFEASGENGLSKLTLSTQKRGIRIFSSYYTTMCFVEEYNLPSTGGCYLVSSSDTERELAKWVAEFESYAGVSNPIPQTGLPSFLTIRYIENIEKAPPEFLNTFPESKVGTVKPSYISLVGGSRITDVASTRRYLEYDLPTVILEARDDTVLNVIGAEISLLEKPHQEQPNIPHRRVEEYDLIIKTDTPSITLEAVNKKTNNILQTRIIAITKNLLEGIHFNSDEPINFDRFGVVSNESGIFGCSIKALSSDELSNNLRRIEDYRQDIDLNNQELSDGIRDERWKLLEALLVKRRFTGQEFKRKVESIIGEWPSYGWSDLQLLQALGHLEIERDEKGRIAYIYNVKASAFKIPWCKGSDSLFGIAGCPSFSQLEKLEKNAKELDLKLFSYERDRSTLPPLIVIQGDEESILLCLVDAHFDYQGSIGDPATSARIAQWSGSLVERSDALQWQEGVINDSDLESVFNPFRFLMLSPEQFNCPYKLFSIADSYSNQNKWYAMVKTAGASDLDERGRHVFLSDLSWGKWLTLQKATPGIPSHVQCPDNENIPLPYDSNLCQLIVPASLRFPTLLYRALVMCSGMPPKLVRQSEFFSKVGSEFLPEEDLPYTRSCHVYQSIPMEIAKLVCQKVSAWPVDITPLQDITFENYEESD